MLVADGIATICTCVGYVDTMCGYIFSTFLHFSLSRRALEELRHTYGADLMQKHTFTVIRRTLPSSILKEEIIRYLEYHECHNTDYMFFLFCFVFKTSPLSS